VEEFGILLDAGDGVSAGLTQKARKVKHVFISHADRDHVAGLLQFNQLNASKGTPGIYYPRDCGSFPALKEFVAKFDPQSGPASWQGVVPETRIEVGPNTYVRIERSEHIEAGENQIKALRFVLYRSKRVLKAEYQGLNSTEIVELKKKYGGDHITSESVENLLGYSGDAPRLNPAAWKGVSTLIHECTFLSADTARRMHSNVVEVLEGANELALKALILCHFSARYKREEIGEAVLRESKRMGLQFPVHVVFPGEICSDVLRHRPVWEPS
jgi:ribonuclease Z